MLKKLFSKKPDEAEKPAKSQGGKTARPAEDDKKAGSGKSGSGKSSTSSSNQQSNPSRKNNSRNNKSSSGNRGSSDNKKASGNTVNNKKSTPSGSRPDPREKFRQQHACWSIDQFQVPEKEGFMRFHDLDLPSELMHAIADLGFEYCSPIQQKTLPYTLQGMDVIGKAQTGTGKTAAFLIKVITDLMNNKIEEQRYAAEPRAVVLAPTRELAMQIADDAELLCKYTTLNVLTLVGGVDFDKQLKQLDRDVVDIVVATPGRLIDFQARGNIHLDLAEILVIDEADRMLDMGFIPQVKSIVRCTPKRTHRQTLLFSATFTDDVINLAERWTLDPLSVEIKPERVATDSVDQKVYLVSADEKFAVLKSILAGDNVDSVIVFANRRNTVRDLHKRLQDNGVKCGILSGEVAQQKRIKTLERFKSGDIKVLVATDVAGRGIHVDGISHVVNYTLPEDPEDYVHRIGRTGRAGSTGISISFACEDDAFLLPDIEELLGQKLDCEQPPEDFLK